MRQLLVLPFLLGACSGPIRQARPPAPGRDQLRVLTYNVNYGLAGDAEGVEAIAGADADVVLLQETTAAWERALEGRYPYAHFEHRGAAGGLAVLSRLPLERVVVLAPPVEGSWFPAMHVVVRTAAGPIELLNLHLRPQLGERGSVISGVLSTPPVRAGEIAAHVRALSRSRPAIVAGDFNEGPGGRATAQLVALGFEDLLESFHPGADTWRWQTSLMEVRQGLDRILTDGRGALSPLDVRVLDAGRSDHLPILATFELIAS